MVFSRSVDGVTRANSTRAPRRIRGWLIVASALATGLFAAYAAANSSGPFSGLRPYVASNLVKSATARTPINAGSLFPSPPPPAVIHQMVSIYYRPASAPSGEGSQGGGESDDNNGGSRPPARQSQPSPHPQHSPDPTPSPGGGGGGGDN